MINNFNVRLLAGGIDSVDSKWTREVNCQDPFFKVYLPLRGRANLIIEGKKRELRPGNIYFISGWHIDKQVCDEFMETAWLHFVPDSTLLQHILLRCGVFRNIPETDYILIKETLQFVKDVFTPYDELHKKSPQFRENVPDYLICRLKAGILTVISDILRDEDYSESVEKTSVLLRLQKALDFMDTNFLENPPLSKVAKKVFMAPNYFHKVFRDTFGITPFEYMLNKRMNIAKELLGFSSLNIKQIAEQSGYEDEFYFSKMFKKHTGVCPAKFRSHGI